MSEGVYWVDANLLLRFLTGEPPELAERAGRILERGEGGELTLRVHPVIVAETVWVLHSFYKRTAEEIAGALVPLFSGHRLRVEDGRVTVAALETMAREGVDFADSYEIDQATRVATRQLNQKVKAWVWGRPPKPPRHRRRTFVYRI